MASTVDAAFNQFMKNTVNLDPGVTKKARGSRDWLLDQIKSFPYNNNNFPDLYSEKDIHFGSFARRTKIRPLDDIDMMIGLHAKGSTYSTYSDRIEIHVNQEAFKLKALCNNGTNILNSRRVINLFVSQLVNVPQYQEADIKRNMEAATLKLISYDWNFDIVPCFFTNVEDQTNRDYYLIPDGYGDWKKTDPRRDRDNVTEVNQSHKGNVLNVVRALKYWNRRPTMPLMGSYLLEAIIVNYYKNNFYTETTQYVDIETVRILGHLTTAVRNNVNDPKDIQGDINGLSIDDRYKISSKAQVDYQKAIEARNLEGEEKHKESIGKWGEIFGSEFPKYS
jgi:hypothetical protein